MFRRVGTGFAGAAAFVLLAAAAPQGDPPPPWAFLVPVHVDDHTPPDAVLSVPGSTVHVSEAQLDSPYHVADWFPQDHPEMPDAVAKGNEARKFWPCAICHKPLGLGDPESAVVAGLPAGYILQQLDEFRSGRRGCAVKADSPCAEDMPQIAARVTAAEAKQAAEYFSHLTYRSRIEVVEAARVPKTTVKGFGLVPVTPRQNEPIGMRIIEFSNDPARENLGDWRVGLTAYVPPGSIARGRALTAGRPGALPCATCHGAGLKGVGMVPPLAGRDPDYIYRQLYDIEYGYRGGPAVAPMLPEVARLTNTDRIAIAAYLASLKG